MCFKSICPRFPTENLSTPNNGSVVGQGQRKRRPLEVWKILQTSLGTQSLGSSFLSFRFLWPSLILICLCSPGCEHAACHLQRSLTEMPWGMQMPLALLQHTCATPVPTTLWTPYPPSFPAAPLAIRSLGWGPCRTRTSTPTLSSSCPLDAG